MPIKKVAVVGASGSLGRPVVQALLDADFTVTAITRPSSTAVFPAGVHVRRADTSSLASVTAAFAGQEAVISTVASQALDSQILLVDAAIAAGVRRFIPSEFGVDVTALRTEHDQPLRSLLAAKMDALEHVETRAGENQAFSWTGYACGIFLDWGLDFGVFGIDWKNKRALVRDSGDEPMSVSTLDFVARGLVAVLQKEEQSRNKYLLVPQFNVSQNELLHAFEDELGKFAVEHASTAGLAQQGMEKIGKGDGSGFVNVLVAYEFGDGGGHFFAEEKQANGLLGLPKSDLSTFVRAFLEERKA